MKNKRSPSVVALINGLDPEGLAEVQSELEKLLKLTLIQVAQLEIGPETPRARVLARALIGTVCRARSSNREQRKTQTDAIKLMFELVDGPI